MDKALEEGWGDRDGDKMEEAARQLMEQGCVVDLRSGYVGWPNREAAADGRMTPEMMGWEKVIREWA
jgi:hypothetical protein